MEPGTGSAVDAPLKLTNGDGVVAVDDMGLVANAMAVTSYALLILISLWVIWVGSHRSRDSTESELLGMGDAAMFPALGSAVLLGLYVALQLLSTELIDLVVTVYFGAIGCFAICKTLKPILISHFPSTQHNSKYKYCIALKLWGAEPLFQLKFDAFDILGWIIGAGVAAWWGVTRHWIPNDIMGISFSVEALSLLSLQSFGVGALLLVALFFYDIFWVFCTDVMVSVATQFKAPIKLLIPKNGLFSLDPKFSLLGLGDIVIPGMFIALMLKVDFSLRKGRSMDKTYFASTYCAYCIGLSVTIFVVHYFKTAQPALLYLVPAVLLTAIFVGLVRRQLKRLVLFSLPKRKKTESKEKVHPKDKTNRKETTKDKAEKPKKETKKQAPPKATPKQKKN
ncbi:minor histocompatibility antigen H13 [Pelomyxa schiedti]|nr:minor histocompatibility antigen H13 [Pelomyxa schiedti]